MRWVLLIGIAITSLAAIAVLVRPQPRFVPYVPVLLVFDRGEPVLIDAPELLTAAHCREFAQLVGSAARFEADRLLIRRSFAQDRELLMNYTQKAEEAVGRTRGSP